MYRSGGNFATIGKKMLQASDVKYYFRLEGDRIAFADHMTVGRHLDNDVLLAGEDVLDFHLRLEMTGRGPRALPLAEASLRVNARDLANAVGLIPGDRLQIGQNELEVDLELVHPPEADAWHLHDLHGSERVIAGACGVGRGDDNAIRLDDDHISRHHAELISHGGLIFLRDLGSANGTFVNGERLTGACRLYHGDEIRFDTRVFQLIGRGADLTPVREPDATPRPAPLQGAFRDGAGDGAGDTTEIAAVDEFVVAAVSPVVGEAGAFLLGASDPVAGMTFRTPIGRTLVGRNDDCDLIIRDRTVSSRHAELMVRSEGVTITNLMSTNGTRVNGQEVQTARLHDGDVIRFGRVSMVFKDVPPTEDSRPWLRRVQLALLVGSLILAAGLITFLL
jgi:pSer/pThr/pTyr-binding forkhead associated (FHA) protein